MDDRPNLSEFLNEVSSFAEEGGASKAVSAAQAVHPIGQVVEIAGSGSQIRMDAAVLTSLQSHSDLSVSM